MRYIFIIIMSFASVTIFANPHRELRAAWIATVFNIDWPSHYSISANQQKDELVSMLNTLDDLNFNAVIIQIKPTSDAFYNSQLSPWSRYLTGVQGKNPGYDPLAFFIEEARKRSIEVHVWINPFRILNGNGGVDSLVSEHIARKNPDWVISYNNNFYFDPGNPDVQKYILKEILEIVKNYDIDVIHMDDYFYPYKVYQNGTLLHFNDDASYKKFGQKMSRDDWRRQNINTFVEIVATSIKKEKSYVKFGISPFGVWRNKSVDPKGSDTQAGQTNYDDLYADVLLWINNSWIDYVMPQVYWDFNTKGVNFDKIVDWWRSNVTNDVNLYIGLGAYRLGEASWLPRTLHNQVMYTRKKNTEGVAYYSMKWIQNDIKGIKNEISNLSFPTPALVPINNNLKPKYPLPPRNITQKLLPKNKLQISWTTRDKNTQYFAIYAVKGDQKTLIDKVSRSSPMTYLINDVDTSVEYGITAVSRLHYESAMMMVDEMEKNKGLDLLDDLLSN